MIFSNVFEHCKQSRQWNRSNRGRKNEVRFLEETIQRASKNCSGPENRDASISSCKHIANAMIFSTVFDPFRAPRSIEASASVDSASKKSQRTSGLARHPIRLTPNQKAAQPPRRAVRKHAQKYQAAAPPQPPSGAGA